MDMRRHLPSWINGSVLDAMGGRYEGTIKDVVEQTVNNRFQGTKQLQPVIVFSDGYRLIPNITMRKALVNMFGPETRNWHGRSIAIFQKPTIRVDERTGEEKRTVTKTVMKLGDDVVAFPSRVAR